MASEYNVSPAYAIEHPLDSLTLLGTALGADIAELFGDPNAQYATGGSLRNWVNNLPVLGDLTTPLTDSQAKYIAANSGASPQLLAGMTDAQKQAAQDEVLNYSQTMTADTSTLSSITSSVTDFLSNPFSSLTDSAQSAIVSVVLVCVVAAAVYYGMKFVVKAV